MTTPAVEEEFFIEFCFEKHEEDEEVQRGFKIMT